MNKIFFYLFVGFCIVTLTAIATYYYVTASFVQNNQPVIPDSNRESADPRFSGDDKVSGVDDDAVFCTMEARECPDGSWVGREGPNCEFAECPTE
jgi:hypothetical protein